MKNHDTYMKLNNHIPYNGVSSSSRLSRLRYNSSNGNPVSSGMIMPTSYKPPLRKGIDNNMIKKIPGLGGKRKTTVTISQTVTVTKNITITSEETSLLRIVNIQPTPV